VCESPLCITCIITLYTFFKSSKLIIKYQLQNNNGKNKQSRYIKYLRKRVKTAKIRYELSLNSHNIMDNNDLHVFAISGKLTGIFVKYRTIGGI
jgi:hypothetical protein